MSAADIIRDALFGNPPSPVTKPSREGVLAAVTTLEINTKAGIAAAALSGNNLSAAMALVTPIANDAKEARNDAAASMEAAFEARDDASASASLAQSVLTQSEAVQAAAIAFGNVAEEIGLGEGVVVYENQGFGVANRTEFTGPAGPANSTYPSIPALKTADAENLSAIVTDDKPGLFAFRSGAFTGRTDDKLIVQAKDTPTTAGAWTKLPIPLAPENFPGTATQAFAAGLASTGDTYLLARDEYQITGITLPAYAKLDGGGSGLAYRASGSGPLIEVLTNDNGIQTTRATEITGFGVRGAIGSTRTGTGFLIRNNAVASLINTTARGCDVGFYYDRAQFTSLINQKAYDNNIGIYCRPSYTEGGANSLTFVHPMSVGNVVGFLLDNTGNQYPQGDIVLLNPQMLGNSVCAFASVGLSNSARTQVYIYGMAPEANGLSQDTAGYAAGAANYTYNGIVIPRSSMYLRYTSLSIIGGAVAEYGATNPAIILESSLLSLHDVTGYGGPTSTFIKADADSQVVISGYYGCIGAAHGVINFTGTLSVEASDGALVGPLRRSYHLGLQNDLSNPDLCGFSGAPGTTSSTITYLPEGRAQLVTFAASGSSSDSNVARFDVPVMGTAGATADRAIVSMTLVASRDVSRLRIAFYPNRNPVYISLLANQPVTVTYFAQNVPVGNQLLTIYPDEPTPTALTLRIQNGHARSGLHNDPVFNADVGAICAGAYNPKAAGLLPRTSQPSPPTESASPVGAVVANSTPSAGGVKEWVHVGGGTWKPVMIGA